MANFAVDFISGVIADLAGLEAHLEDDLPTQYNHEEATATPVSTTSATFAAIATESGVAVASDELVLLLALANFSGDNAGDLVEFDFAHGSTQIWPVSFAINSQTSTGGNRQLAPMFYVAQGLNGTYDFHLRHRRVSGSGTLYSNKRFLTCLKFKRRA